MSFYEAFKVHEAVRSAGVQFVDDLSLVFARLPLAAVMNFGRDESGK